MSILDLSVSNSGFASDTYSSAMTRHTLIQESADTAVRDGGEKIMICWAD